MVGRPSASTAQPSGIGSPRCLAETMLPRATFDRERSTTTGSRPGRGQAKAMGLVPNTARLPFQGAMAAGVLAKSRATRPRLARSSTNSPAAPQWCERRIAAAARPLSRAMAGSGVEGERQGRIGEAARRIDGRHRRAGR